MSSFVFYRFKSQKQPSRISFDGTGISVFDLKKEILLENRMLNGSDFDFAIYNEGTDEEYTSDHTIVPRSTSVIARRLPPSRPGRGNAQEYLVGVTQSAPNASHLQQQPARPPGGWSSASMSKSFDQQPAASSAAAAEQVQVVVPETMGDEASAMQAMFAAQNQQWQETQDKMASATPIYRPGQTRPPRQYQQQGSGAGGANYQRKDYTNKPLPPNYVCYRCGEKDHHITMCPKNSDRSYDDRPRIKRTTGIPKSFLTTVEGPAASDNVQSGLMVTAEGGFVIAKPDSASWFAHRKATNKAHLTATDVQNLAPSDPDLTCPICSKLLNEAVITPCCQTSFCNDCLTNALYDNDMLCPECESRIKTLDKVRPDESRRERVKDYIERTLAASKALEEEEAEQARKQAEEEEAARKEAENEREEGEEDPANPTMSEQESSSVPAATPERQQQQQGFRMPPGAGMLPPPPVIVQTLYRLSMVLSNPQLPPPMRMIAQMQMLQAQSAGLKMGLLKWDKPTVTTPVVPPQSTALAVDVGASQEQTEGAEQQSSDKREREEADEEAVEPEPKRQEIAV